MSKPTVDPARFRLRTFEADWVQPLLDGRESDLRALLLAEARRWIELGQALGYFGIDLVLIELPEPDWLKPAFEFPNEPDLSPDAFGQLLAEAQEDLTRARWEFLELAFFASEAMWRERLGQISMASVRFETSPASRFPVELVDEIRWGLEGVGSQIGTHPTTPARWRSADLSVLHSLREGGATRIAELGRARQALAGSAGLGVTIGNAGYDKQNEDPVVVGEALIDAGRLGAAEEILRSTTPDGTGRQQLQLARIEVQRSHVPEAKALLREATEADLPVAWYLLGVVLHAEKARETAREALERAESCGVPAAGFSLAELFNEQGDVESAEAALRRAAAAGEPRALASLAGSLALRGEAAEAVRLLAGAHRTVPAETLLQVGKLLGENGDDAEASEILLEADLAGAHGAAGPLAQVRKRQGRVGAAEDWYRKAIAAGRTYAHLNLGVLLQARGDLDGAETQYGLALESGDTGAHLNLGSLYLERGDRDKAQRAFEDAIESGDTKAHLPLGRFLRDDGAEPEQVEHQFMAALAAGFDEALFELESLLIEQGRFTEAQKMVEDAIERDLDGAWCRKGALQEKLGEPDAQATYERGAELGDAAAAYNLGVLLDRSGDSKDAERSYERAHELGFSRAANNLGSLLLRRDARKAAATWFDRAIAAGDSRGLVSMATLLRLDGRLGEALLAAQMAARAGEPSAFLVLASLAEDVGSTEELRDALAMAKQHDIAPAWGQLGELHMEAGELESAESELREGWRRSDPLSGLLLSRLLRQRDRPTDAERVARELLSLTEARRSGDGTAWIGPQARDRTPLQLVLPIGRGHALMELGAALEDQDRVNEAFLAFEEAAHIGMPEAAANVAILYRRRGDEMLEREWLERAAKLDSPTAVLYLGDVLWRDGSYEDAERMIVRANELGHPYAMAALGSFLYSRGRLAAAERAFATACERSGAPPSDTYELGVVREQRGDLEGAAEAYAEVMEQLPGAAYNLGVVRDLLGDQAGAVVAYRIAAKSGHETARSNLGAVLLEMGALDEAETVLSELASEGHAGAIHNLGNLLLIQGHRAEARARFEVSARRGVATSLVSIGRMQTTDGQFMEAATTFQQALAAGAPEATADLGEAYERLGELERAAALYRQALEEGNTSFAQKLGYITGRTSLADEIVEKAMTSFDSESALILRDATEGLQLAPRSDELVETRLTGIKAEVK